MIQKIIKVGNSAAVTIPKEFLTETGIQIGDELIIETNVAAQMFLAKTKKQAGKMSLTPEFYTWLDNISEKYKDVIKELART